MEIGGGAALVSGGASGLGRATARALAAAGVKVAILDVHAEAAAEAAKEIGGLPLACDVTDAASVERAVAAARQQHGPARIAVCCAGIGTGGRIVGRNGPMPLDDFRRVVEVNLIGSFNLLRLAAADMTGLDPLPDGERGLVVLTASVAAYEGQIGQAAYSASKGGIVGLTLPAARELAQFGVRVMAIAPGIFATPMLAGLPQPVQDSLAASVPFPARLGRSEEYAGLVLELCRNPMLNGSVIRLGARFGLVDCALNESTEIDPLFLEAHAGDIARGQVEDVVDQLRQAFDRFEDGGNVILALLAEAPGIVGRQDDLDPVVDIEDLRVVIHFLGGERDTRQKAPGFGEIAEVITLADRVAVLDLAPAMQLAQRRLPRRPDQPVDHAALHALWLASEPAAARGQAGPARR